MNSFDSAALNYDNEFTKSKIGELQRSSVWNYLERNFAGRKSIKILELNCGTGEDAIFFGRNGYKVLATDASEQMIKLANQKVVSSNLTNNISFLQLRIEDISEQRINEKFDLIFSNFGGLNCISEEQLIKVAKIIPALLNKQGQFIAVIMPRFCAWENFYFLIKLRWKKIFRRSSNIGIIVNVSGEHIETWYYGPHQFAGFFSKHFKLNSIKPVGFFVPPSYMEEYFIKKQSVLNFLGKMDKLFFSRIGILGGVSDHCLIDLKLK